MSPLHRQSCPGLLSPAPGVIAHSFSFDVSDDFENPSADPFSDCEPTLFENGRSMEIPIVSLSQKACSAPEFDDHSANVPLCRKI
jgi:hypothetical protein